MFGYIDALDRAALGQAIKALVGGAPGALDTLKEISTALENKDDALASLVDQLARKADKVRKINGSGLVTGGGDLSKDQTLEVRGASDAEASAMTSRDVALTPGNLSTLRTSSLMAVPTGVVLWFAAEDPPTGYLVCDGATLNRTSYAALFSVIGTTFGAGDGSIKFDLPDLRGEFVRGFNGSDFGQSKVASTSLSGTARVNASTYTNSFAVGGTSGSTRLTLVRSVSAGWIRTETLEKIKAATNARAIENVLTQAKSDAETKIMEILGL